MNHLLIGPRASGKTSVGRVVASTAGLRFIDLDDAVLGRFDQPTTADVWRVHGESAWRAAEVAALEEALRADHQLVALGGGVPMIGSAREAIERERRAGRVQVVYLRCSAAELSRRLEAAPGDRPSLTGRAVAEEVADVLALRAGTYEALADVILEAGGATDQVADRLVRVLRGGR